MKSNRSKGWGAVAAWLMVAMTGPGAMAQGQSKLAEALDRPISVKYASMTLRDVVADLQGRTGVNIHCDPNALGPSMPYLELRVSLDAENIKVGTAMTLILRPLKLMCAEDADTLRVTASPPPGPGNRSLGTLDDELVRTWKKWRAAKDPADPEAVRSAKEFAEVEAAIAQVDAILARARDKNWDKPAAPIEKVGEVKGDREVKPVSMKREYITNIMPDYVVEASDIIEVKVLEALKDRPIQGEHLVQPDGRISIGYYGEVYVSGLTVAETKEKVILHLRDHLSDKALGLVREDTGKPVEVAPRDSDRVSVKVVAYNSKVYYVQGDVGSPGRLPITGNETVLDALTLSGGLIPMVETPIIRLVRPGPPDAHAEQTLPVDLKAIVERGDTATNHPIKPGDRLVVSRPATVTIREDRSKEIERKLEVILKKIDWLYWCFDMM